MTFKSKSVFAFRRFFRDSRPPRHLQWNGKPKPNPNPRRRQTDQHSWWWLRRIYSRGDIRSETVIRPPDVRCKIHPKPHTTPLCPCTRPNLRPTQRNTYTVSQKTSPTFSAVTWKPIIRFSQLSVQILLTPLVIKWLFSFPPHPMYAFALKANQAKYALK